MKAKCVNADHITTLTVGEVYDVKSASRKTIRVINDEGEDGLYYRTRFEFLEEDEDE